MMRFSALMMRIGFAFALLILLSSCKRCRDNEWNQVGFQPGSAKYFAMYKPGNWWVYENQDSTKKDSMYVYDFLEIIERVTVNQCLKYPKRNFKLASAYLDPQNGFVDVKYENNENCCSDYFHFETVLGAVFDSRTDVYPKNTAELEDSHYDSLIINNVTYYNVIDYYSGTDYSCLFAPSVGLLRFIRTNNDTFTIKNYHVN